ncbi:MAG: hypothetical protein AB2689_05970 [Candidatus Thiodiazotropha taylori]
MANHFSENEWQEIESALNSNPTAYGLPQRVDNSIVIASWNIRKFGTLMNGTVPKKSPGAFRMIKRFCAQCDLVAIQEQQDSTESLYKLIADINSEGRHFQVVISDLTGRAPGYKGMAERFAWLYNTEKIKRGDLASDLTYDRTAITKNISDALASSIRAEVPHEDAPGFIEKLYAWADRTKRLVGSNFLSFVQFVRSPHIVEFLVPGNNSSYEIYCINAHLVSGKSKKERSQEFFALLEWLLLDSRRTVERDSKIVMLLADLNLDFESSIDKRRLGIAKYITSLNEVRKLKAKVNFPFLDGDFFTNARETETFDHIAWISNDSRMPRGRHNKLAGTLGENQFDYGMFNFTKLFREAGNVILPSGKTDYSKFEHDLSDHMPIWIRLPVPSKDQIKFQVS